MILPDIVQWAESPSGFYLQETKRPIRLADHQKAILRHVFTPDSSGKLPYDTILYSCPKKSGKTTLAALVALWFALFVESPNEIFMVANSLEQSIGRSYTDLAKSIRLNPVLKNRLDVQKKVVNLDHGTVITALSSDYSTAAGSRHGLTVWDELWAYSTESSYRLFDELTPVPVKRNSIRLIVSYAGFEGESELLETLYRQGLEGKPVPELAHIENGKGSPACRASGRLFMYWDHQLREHGGLQITPAQYHQEQRKQLRPSAYLRLHENEWASSISTFVTKEQWQACFSSLVRPWQPGGPKMVLGADASTSRDLTALVGLCRGPDRTAHVIYVKVWKPQKSELRAGKPTIDLSETIGAEIKRLYELGAVEAVCFDPYQLHSIALDLQKSGARMIELPQTAARVQADQSLYDAIIGQSLKHYNHPELSRHILNAVAQETARGFRIQKEKTRLHIDLAVALSMAHYGLGSYTLQEPAGEIITPSMDIYKSKRKSIWDEIAPGREKIQPLFDRRPNKRKPGVKSNRIYP